MTPEGRVKKEIKQYLDSIGAYYFMPVQTGYGAKTLDFLVCVKGRFVAIEAKAPGEESRPFQKLIIGFMEKAGAHVFVVDSDESLEQLKFFVSIHGLDK